MEKATKTNNPQPAAIVAIECDLLFGHYTYKLRLADDGDDTVRSRRLLLLYGDNGSGKTTIAQLLFHMLSPEDGRGHRTFLARTKFHRFCICFDNGFSFAAERDGNTFDGPYSLKTYNSDGEKILSVEVGTSEDGAVRTGNVDEGKLKNILSIASPSSFDVYFLSDNRVLQSDVFDDEPSEEWMGHHGRIITRRHGDTREQMLVASRTRDLTVGPSIWRAESWLRQQAIRASNDGEVTTSNIYIDIIKRIVQISNEPTEDAKSKLNGLVDSLGVLEERSKAFTALGLSQPVPLETLNKHIRSVRPEQSELLANVLEPYVNSIKSRLDAFANLEQRLSAFLEIINEFYKRKTVRITTSDGIQVYDERKDLLDASVLSSGEKQHLLLLCNILVVTTKPSIFIIDEPELSLNVKWQRKLVDSLLSLVKGSHVQFIMATHSIEVLTRHKECVLKLDDLSASVVANS